MRFNAEGPAGLIRPKAPGNPSKLDDAQRAERVRIVVRGPDPAVDEVVRWRLMGLAAWVWEEFAISISEATLSREPKALGFSKIPARPRHHDQNPDAVDAFKRLPRPPGEDPDTPPGRDRNRALVPGRSAGRSKEQDRPPL